MNYYVSGVEAVTNVTGFRMEFSSRFQRDVYQIPKWAVRWISFWKCQSRCKQTITGLSLLTHFQRYKRLKLLERKGICEMDFFRESCAVNTLIPKEGRCFPSPQLGLHWEDWRAWSASSVDGGKQQTGVWVFGFPPRTSDRSVKEIWLQWMAYCWGKRHMSVATDLREWAGMKII